MGNIAEHFDYVVGVDTHARSHTFTIVTAATGVVAGTKAFPSSAAGMRRAIAWIRRRTERGRVFAAVEGTSSYGAKLTDAGVGPVTAAIIICAYSHPGRVRNEAAFAALGGVAPLPASSGNTTRLRLSRSGDRQLNRALDVIARTRMSCDSTTRSYVDRSRASGKSSREIRRNLKRYISRQIFRQLNARTA